jgi:hypothetical protein
MWKAFDSVPSPCMITVPVDRLATRDPQRRAWRPAEGKHRFTVARFAGDPDAVTVAVTL